MEVLEVRDVIGERSHYMWLSQYERRPPIVLAGDWTDQACVEGAVRSGEAAAAFG